MNLEEFKQNLGRYLQDEKCWLHESNYLSFTSHGFRCTILRSHYGGVLCGYIRIPSENHYYRKNYDEIGFEVHGGLTYGAPNLPGDLDPEPDWFYYGFDCNHIDDLNPACLPWHTKDDGVYRSMHYVIEELETLAKQFAERS